ncbi:MAG: glycine--tRNA ligase subunit beta [Alphaproteobacteria bacterium]|nr:glycine--tRNA ligase subunit beta [Alphaproteobacteria bacterium]
MADLLLELFSEEIPARMQKQAAADLERLVVGALSDRGLLFEGAKTFYGPRRLTLVLAGLPVKQPDVSEEKKGPRVNAPAKAIDGFLRSAGVTLEQCEKRDDGKGEFYVAVIARKGRATAEVLAEVLPECFAKLPWPKSMRWPQASNAPVRWVRPLHSILCTLDGEVVPFTFAGVATGTQTRGHRFLSSGVIEAKRFEDYAKKLHDAHVVIDAEQRKAIIFEGVKQAAFVHGLELIPDEGLLEEVAGLAEWPMVLIGAIETQFMDVPAEILQTAMRVHQKYFSLRDPKTGKFANRFAVVSNMVASDGGKEIVAGNERVLRARLSDAKFFWDQDRKTPLADRVAALGGIVFHAKLGTQLERVERIESLAGEIAAKIGADVAKAKRAARLAKADLTSGVVGEFPELQGVMGRYYALNDGEDVEVADAVRDHYKPQGPNDAVPTNKVSVAVALADKLDQLIGFFGAGEKPTGSGDPFALRRAALGIIRILLEGKLRLPLSVSKELLEFFADRLKVALREKGTRHDLIDAVFSLGNEDDLVRLVARVEALQAFLKTDDGANLLAGYKRAANILRVEEKKDDHRYGGEVIERELSEPQETALYTAVARAQTEIAPALEREDFAAAMRVMAGLRAPVDAFFDKVKVNADDKKVRANRLNLLAALRSTLHQVADFSKIEG